MQSSLLRTISLIMLLLSILTLSGLTTTASALIHAETVAACCDKERDGENRGGLPCSMPDCPCLACMAVDLVNAPALRRTTAAETVHYTSQQKLHLSAYLSSIEYPPETA